MKVILLEEVKKLGKPGDIVEVKAGFYRNFLAPNKFAAECTPQSMRIAEKKKVEAAKKAAEEKDSAIILKKSLETIEIKILQKAGEKNQLFGSVTNQQIADALKEKGFEIDKHKIVLDEPIKSLGNYTVAVKLHHEVSANLNIIIEKEEAN